jgi:hypothetical protein
MLLLGPCYPWARRMTLLTPREEAEKSRSEVGPFLAIRTQAISTGLPVASAINGSPAGPILRRFQFEHLPALALEDRQAAGPTFPCAWLGEPVGDLCERMRHQGSATVNTRGRDVVESCRVEEDWIGARAVAERGA